MDYGLVMLLFAPPTSVTVNDLAGRVVSGLLVLAGIPRRGLRHRHSSARALRSVALEICIKPVNGALNSKTRKTAPAAERAKTNKVMTEGELSRESIRKLAKVMAQPLRYRRVAHPSVGTVLVTPA